MPATLGISIMICCYNSEKRIVPTLQHLSKLKTDGIAVEIILVNNASTDDTEMVAGKHGRHCIAIMILRS